MRALIQRTFKSALSVDGKLISEIPSGLTIFLGIEKGDCFSTIALNLRAEYEVTSKKFCCLKVKNR